jgi:hypothetical protein
MRPASSRQAIAPTSSRYTQPDCHRARRRVLQAVAQLPLTLRTEAAVRVASAPDLIISQRRPLDCTHRQAKHTRTRETTANHVWVALLPDRERRRKVQGLDPRGDCQPPRAPPYARQEGGIPRQEDRRRGQEGTSERYEQPERYVTPSLPRLRVYRPPRSPDPDIGPALPLTHLSTPADSPTTHSG